MFARVKVLSWWKQIEHNEETCEDAYRSDIKKGLFAVADGMSTVVFSRLWARLLVDYFVTVPLIGKDPFETEWWLRPVQLEYGNKSPKVETLQPSVRSKAREGSAATLATMRISTIQDSISASAELLAVGDSCIFVGNFRRQLVNVTFPLSHPSDFDRAPVGLPSLAWKYNRRFHLATSQQITLQPDDVVILATDAVSKWIMSNGDGTYATMWGAFKHIISLKPDDEAVASPGSEGTWSHFIQQCRDAGHMVNDDVTALIVTFLKQGEESERLEATPVHSPLIIEQRKKDFQESVEKNLKDLIAINYGSGEDFTDLPYPDIENVRNVADALSSVWQAFRGEINSPDIVAKMRPVLERYGPLLVDEPCAEDLKNKLKQFNISFVPSRQEPQGKILVPLPPTPTKSEPVHKPAPVDTSSPQSTATDIQNETPSPQPPSTTSAGSGQEEHKQLVSNFYKALSSKDWKRLRDAEKAIRQSTYPELSAYIDMEQESIQNIYQGKQVVARLHDAMDSKVSMKEKLDAYNAAYRAGYRRFAPDIEEQMQLASKLLHACWQNDDDAISNASNEIQRAGLDRYFEYSEEEKLLITQARRNTDALELFRRVVNDQSKGGSITTQIVCEAYNSLLAIDSKLQQRLSPQERYEVHVAEQYTQTHNSNSDKAWDIIYYSPFRFSFQNVDMSSTKQEKEQERRQKNYQYPDVASVKNTTININEYMEIYAVIKAYREEIIWQLHVLAAGKRSSGLLVKKQPKPSLQLIPAIQSRISLLREKMTPQTILVSMVDDLILQNSDIKSHDSNEIKNLSTDAAHQIVQVREGRYYEEILKTVMAIFIRYAFADSYFQQQQNLEQWLSEQKQTMRIVYPECAIIDQSGSNNDPVRSWVLKWSYLVDDIRQKYNDLFE